MTMQPIPEDYVPPESGEYETFDDGEYTVQGFDWISVNDSERPILVAQKDGRMVGRLRFKLDDGEEGPVYSLEMRSMPVLVLAFEGDVDKLPEQPSLNQPGKISAYMDIVQSLCITGKTTVVHVKDEWVRWIEGMDIVGKYQFVLEDMWPKDDNDEPVTREGKFTPFITVYFRVTAGEGGSPTKYKDAYFSEIYNYAVVVNEGADGVPEIDWKRTPVEKGFTSDARRLSKLMQYTAPSMFEEGYVVSNPYNLLPEWLREVKSGELVEMKGERAPGPKGGRVKLDGLNIELVLPTVITEPEVQPPAPETVLEDAKARDVLVTLLTVLNEGAESAFITNTLDVTSSGRETAKKYLGPLRAKGVLSHGVIKNLSFDEVQAIFKNIEVPEVHKETLTKLRHQVDAIGVRVDNTEDIF